MTTKALGIGLDINVVKGHRLTRRKIEDQLGKWEHREYLVNRFMPGKGFSTVEVAAALAECNKMLDWYDRLLEQYE